MEKDSIGIKSVLLVSVSWTGASLMKIQGEKKKKKEKKEMLGWDDREFENIYSRIQAF